MNKLFLVGIIILVVVSLVVFVSKKQPDKTVSISPAPTVITNEPILSPKPTSENVLQLPKMEIDKTKKYTATLTVSKGVIKVELFADKTPVTVNNFVSLSRKNFYDNTVFHRVIKGFMIQGGDPKGDGTGGPGYKFDDEPFEGEYTRGTIAMANSGPNTNGSQFFIVHKDNPLPKNYVIFGKVIEGINVVDQIAEAPVGPNSSGEPSKPAEPVVLQSVVVSEE